MSKNKTTTRDSTAGLVAAGVSISEMANQLGISKPYIHRIIKETYPGYVPTNKGPKKLAFSSDTIRLRVMLGTALYDLKQCLGNDPVATAAATGLNRYDQIEATHRPYEFDWRISQMQRVFDAAGKKLNLLDLLSPGYWASQEELDEFHIRAERVQKAANTTR